MIVIVDRPTIVASYSLLILTDTNVRKIILSLFLLLLHTSKHLPHYPCDLPVLCRAPIYAAVFTNIQVSLSVSDSRVKRKACQQMHTRKKEEQKKKKKESDRHLPLIHALGEARRCHSVITCTSRHTNDEEKETQASKSQDTHRWRRRHTYVCEGKGK